MVLRARLHGRHAQSSHPGFPGRLPPRRGARARGSLPPARGRGVLRDVGGRGRAGHEVEAGRGLGARADAAEEDAARAARPRDRRGSRHAQDDATRQPRQGTGGVPGQRPARSRTRGRSVSSVRPMERGRRPSGRTWDGRDLAADRPVHGRRQAGAPGGRTGLQDRQPGWRGGPEHRAVEEAARWRP